MKRIGVKICVCIFSIMFMSSVYAQGENISSKTAEQVALEALKILSELTTPQNYREMGFKGLEDARTTSVGEYFVIYWVGLDQLKEYKKGDDPRKMLSGGDQRIYSVLSRGVVSSSITLSNIKGQWEATSFGESPTIKSIENSVSINKRNVKDSEETYFFVKLLALNLEFIGYYQDDTLMLAPLYDYPDFGFTVNTPIPAVEVFEKVQPTALEHDGLPW
ncbi:MAG: hypothetical protein JW765_03410 [Deltaproteobacteria bacterium]|nr:hypothetical protein [Candidatus Zymogenaceae bacterium]